MDQPSKRFSAFDEFERDHVRPREGRTLIVGSRIYRDKPDRRALFKDAVGVDMLDGDGVDVVCDLEEDVPTTLGRFSHVECRSVLEHSRRPWLLAANLERMMLPGASLYLTVPFCWRVHGYPSDYWRFTREGVRELFRCVDWDRLTYAHILVSDSDKMPAYKDEAGNAFLARTEVCGFGRRMP